MLVYVASPMGTVLSNPQPLIYGDVVLQGLRPYDAFSAAAYKAIDLIPFILGYNLLDRPRDRHEVLRALVIAALGYSLLMLIEIRLSPQLHNWLYGFFPHSFGQQMRGDGFRPVVFLGHGLLVAIFTSMAVVVGRLSRETSDPDFTFTVMGLAGLPHHHSCFVSIAWCPGLSNGSACAAIYGLRARQLAQICAIGASARSKLPDATRR